MMRSIGQRSFLKTVLLTTSAFAVAAAAMAYIAEQSSGALRIVLYFILAPLAAVLFAVTIGGCVAMVRDSAQTRAAADLFARFNSKRREAAFTQQARPPRPFWPRVLRTLAFSRRLLVGDVVEICSLDTIQATLDSTGSVDGLPFMPEMRRWVGRSAIVYRVVDKVYDYRRTSRLRRIDDTVLLAGLRCDGAAHGGCQADCYVMWKSSWLRRASPTGNNALPASSVNPARSEISPTEVAEVKYSCQLTEVHNASKPMSAFDLRQDWRPLAAGNVTLKAWILALLTRLFNYVQVKRGGVDYPARPSGTLTATPLIKLELLPGQRTRVADATEIAATLDTRDRNRGLWFDREMLKFCGQCRIVHKRVSRIIDAPSGKLMHMRTPCIILSEADNSGEFLRFCAQHEQLFWREAWLMRDA